MVQTGRELVVTRSDLLERPDMVSEAVASETTARLQNLASQMIELSRLCAAIMVDSAGDHPVAPILDERSFSASPKAVRDLRRFLGNAASYGKILGISEALAQPVSRLVRSLRLVVGEGLAKDKTDNALALTAKRAYAKAYGVPFELVELAGSDGLPLIRFYLDLADWWARQVIAAQGAYEAAVKALADQERKLGNSATMAENYGRIFARMESERAAIQQKIRANTDSAAGKDVVASVGSGSDAAIKDVERAAAALRENHKLYEKFDKNTLAALRAQLEVGRQTRNAPGAERSLEHLRRVVEARLRILYLCVHGLDLPLNELEGMMLAGMADMAEFQQLAFSGVVDLQKGLLAAAHEEFASTNQGFEQQLLNVGRSDVVDGEYKVEEIK